MLWYSIVSLSGSILRSALSVVVWYLYINASSQICITRRQYVLYIYPLSNLVLVQYRRVFSKILQNLWVNLLMNFADESLSSWFDLISIKLAALKFELLNLSSFWYYSLKVEKKQFLTGDLDYKMSDWDGVRSPREQSV